MRWRCLAASSTRCPFSRRRAAARPITLPNGTGAVGRRWVRGLAAAALCLRSEGRRGGRGGVTGGGGERCEEQGEVERVKWASGVGGVGRRRVRVWVREWVV